MTGEQIFDIWTPATSRWAVWAKPVLFTDLSAWEGAPAQHFSGETLNVDWVKDIAPDSTLIVDLPGAQSLLYALALAKAGYQPVPLFNCCASRSAEEVLPTLELRAELARGASDLQAISLAPEARPAFILDANRLVGKGIPNPGMFDNRWMAFPQDFPSGNFLRESGINNIVLIQAHSVSPQEDLRQVFLRWQEAGLQILSKSIDDSLSPDPIKVTPTPKYRWFFMRALAMTGFRHNSAAGFGSVIPEPSSGAGVG